MPPERQFFPQTHLMRKLQMDMQPWCITRHSAGCYIRLNVQGVKRHEYCACSRAGMVTSEYAKTFYLGTKLMTPEKVNIEGGRRHQCNMNYASRVQSHSAEVILLDVVRQARAVWAIYVWCRRTDELVDGPNASRITPEVGTALPALSILGSVLGHGEEDRTRILCGRRCAGLKPRTDLIGDSVVFKSECAALRQNTTTANASVMEGCKLPSCVAAICASHLAPSLASYCAFGATRVNIVVAQSGTTSMRGVAAAGAASWPQSICTVEQLLVLSWGSPPLDSRAAG